jgi:hypothetical protein
MDPNAVLNRVMRLARLDTTVFDEVKDDINETIPAVVVGVVSWLLAGLGAWLYWTVVTDIEPENVFLNTVVLGTVFGVILYFAAIAIAYVVLVQMYRIQTDIQSLIRVGGYAAIPMAASVLMLIPAIWPVFAIVPLALLFVMMIYAVQSASNADSTQVVWASLIGFTVMTLILGFIALKMSGDVDAPIGAGLFGTLYDFS